MRRFRWVLFGIVLLASAILAYWLRDVIYDLIVVPLAYTLWLLELVYVAVPQLVKWVVLLVLLSLGIIWRLIPDLSVVPAPRPRKRPIEGRLASLAIGLQRARASNYFKWQIANRLGRLARRVLDSPAYPAALDRAEDPVSRYLDAGLNHSFVDYPTPRNRFAARPRTPLDLDPSEVVAFLESGMDMSHDRST